MVITPYELRKLRLHFLQLPRRKRFQLLRWACPLNSGEIVKATL